MPTLSAFDLERIERERIVRGLTKRALAASAGIDPMTYHRIMKGEIKSPHPPTIKAICDALGLPMQEIYIGDRAEVA